MTKIKPNPSWADLNPFILSKIFACLSLHDQLLGPPYVCRSWLSATLDTLFPNSKLDLRVIENLNELHQRLRYTHLLKLAVNHYHGWVSICFPRSHMFEHFTVMYIAERTPNISCAVLPADASVDVYSIFMSLIYWKNLKVFHAPLSLDEGFQFISQLVDHCKNIVELGVHGEFMEKELSCIVEGLPRLKVLDLSESTLSVNALAIVLDGRLKYIRELNIMHCLFLDDDGKDIRKDYMKLKDFKDEMLEKVSGFKSLKKFMHCLAKTCQECNERSLEEE